MGNQTIHDNQLQRMEACIKSIDNTPLKISMIKNAVWLLDSKTSMQFDDFKVRKKKLKLLHKILDKCNA